MIRSLLRRSICALRGHPLAEEVYALCPVTYLALGWKVCACGRKSRVLLPEQLGIIEERKAVKR